MSARRPWLAVIAVLLGAWLTLPAKARAAGTPDAVLAGTNIAALAVHGETVLAGSFDAGLYAVDARGRISRFEDPALNPDVNALLVDRAGAFVYVGTARGLVRCVLDTRRCERLGPRVAVHAILELRDGTVLAGGDVGLVAAWPDGRTTAFDRKGGAPFRAVWALAEAADGTVLVGATNGLSWASPAFLRTADSARWKSAFHRASMVTGHLPDDWVTALAVDGAEIHVGTYNSGIVSFKLESGRLTTTATDVSLGYVNPAGIVPLAGGRLAVATMDGLRIGSPGAWTTIPTLSRDVTALVHVPGGPYFVGTRRGIGRVEVRE